MFTKPLKLTPQREAFSTLTTERSSPDSSPEEFHIEATFSGKNLRGKIDSPHLPFLQVLPSSFPGDEELEITSLDSYLLSSQASSLTQLKFQTALQSSHLAELRKYASLVDLNQKFQSNSGEEMTPLQYACKEGSLVLVVFLLDEGVHLGNVVQLIRDLHERQHVSLLKFLILRTYSSWLSQDKDEIIHLLSKGSFEILQWMLEEGLEINISKEGLERGMIPPLAIAIEREETPWVRFLLEKGVFPLNHYSASIDDANSEKLTPLMRASFQGNFEIVEMLLGTRKCDFQLKSHSLNEKTALYYAIRGGDVRIVKRLLNFHFEPRYYDIVSAIHSKSKEMIDAVLSAPLDMRKPENISEAAFERVVQYIKSYSSEAH